MNFMFLVKASSVLESSETNIKPDNRPEGFMNFILLVQAAGQESLN